MGDIKITVNQVLDFFPMVLLEGIITKGCHNWHCTLESINHIFKLSLNGIVLEVLFKSHANLGIVVSLSGNFLSLNIVELSLNPDLLQFFPVSEGAPHDATKLKIFSQDVELLKYGWVGLENLLVLVVL